MKLAIIGSRNLSDLDVEKYIPEGIDEIVSGGARGIDTLAKELAVRKNIKMTEFLPEYERYGRAALIMRNKKIAEYADQAVVFWDGRSKGTANTIKAFEKLGKKVSVFLIDKT